MGKQEQDQTATATSERRAEPRIRTGRSVLLKTPEGPPTEAWVLDVSTKGLRVRLSAPVPLNVSVKVEAHNLLLFGTIVRCQVSKGAYEAGIVFSFPLEMLSELQRLNTALLSDSDPL